MSKNLLVLFQSSYGSTARIANKLAEQLRGLGHNVSIFDVKSREWRKSGRKIADYEGLCVGSRVHVSKHGSAIKKALSRDLEAVTAIPSAFFQVSMAANAPEGDEKESDLKNLQTFLSELGWKPNVTARFAGSLMYTKYNFFIRSLMKSISAKTGKPTDTSCDHEYTNWSAVEAFGNGFAALL